MVKLGTSPNAYVHRPMPGPDAPPFKDRRFNKEYLELFEYIVRVHQGEELQGRRCRA
ncbi:MAG: hypothetical protein KatS3mg015_2887 [Fimbriimonadales bacterium]|nr:MAG: hypothetical protein KatS3mg015_2887 [Fimbriimonadales bacterium]